MRRKKSYIKRDVLEEEARKQQEELEAERQAEEDTRRREEEEREAREKAELLKPKPQPMIRIRFGLAAGVFAWPIDSNNGRARTVEPAFRKARRF